MTKERLRRGYASLDALRQDVEGQQEQDIDLKKTKPEVGTNGTKPKGQALLSPHPRWIRINTLKTSLDMQLASTFSGYRCVLTLHEVLNGKPLDKVLHIDEHIPNLLALPPAADLSTTPAYRKGLLIFQDKASCFPAYLLDPQPGDGDCLDACAAPGNKTTHLAALTHGSVRSIGQSRIWACERDKSRAKTLEKMVDIAGADELVTIKAGQDFLRLDPEQSPWRNVRSLLLDPSCSGSGIIGRDEILPIVLPAPATPSNPDTPTRKRKRSRNTKLSPTNPEADVDHCASKETTEKKLQARLDSLSAFQTNMLLHAFKFPRARKITYSTCSTYTNENEEVVTNALKSTIAKKNGWKILSRRQQVPGMRDWEIRGNVEACKEGLGCDGPMAEEIAESCIRCNKGTQEGTQGFFVAAFVKEKTGNEYVASEEEWEGILDET